MQAGGDSRVPKVAGGVGRAVLVLPVPLAWPAMVPWHTPQCRARGCAPVAQQFPGDVPLHGQETPLRGSPGSIPRRLKPPATGAVGLPAPLLTVCGKRPDEK